MKLADFLAQKSITHTDFAALIGVSQVSVTRYIAGRRTPRPNVLQRIRDVTEGNVTANDFMVEAAE
jgi:predicted transcriptional regulator